MTNMRYGKNVYNKLSYPRRIFPHAHSVQSIQHANGKLFFSTIAECAKYFAFQPTHTVVALRKNRPKYSDDLVKAVHLDILEPTKVICQNHPRRLAQILRKDWSWQLCQAWMWQWGVEGISRRDRSCAFLWVNDSAACNELTLFLVRRVFRKSVHRWRLLDFPSLVSFQGRDERCWCFENRGQCQSSRKEVCRFVQLCPTQRSWVNDSRSGSAAVKSTRRRRRRRRWRPTTA